MKNINQFINEYIVKKKLDKPIDSEDHYEYHPKTKGELIDNISELVEKNIYDFNCIDTSAITDMVRLFSDTSIKTKIKNINIDISRWNVHNVKNMKGMFFEYNSFNCDLSGWDVSNVTDMSFMFDSCKNFEGKGLENWNVSNVTNMRYMFSNCDNFKGNVIENWDVSNVEDMSFMFDNCKKFEGKGIENWNVSNIKYMSFMFDGCTSLKNKPSWYKE